MPNECKQDDLYMTATSFLRQYLCISNWYVFFIGVPICNLTEYTVLATQLESGSVCGFLIMFHGS